MGRDGHWFQTQKGWVKVSKEKEISDFLNTWIFQELWAFIGCFTTRTVHCLYLLTSVSIYVSFTKNVAHSVGRKEEKLNVVTEERSYVRYSSTVQYIFSFAFYTGYAPDSELYVLQIISKLFHDLHCVYYTHVSLHRYVCIPSYPSTQTDGSSLSQMTGSGRIVTNKWCPKPKTDQWLCSWINVLSSVYSS